LGRRTRIETSTLAVPATASVAWTVKAGVGSTVAAAGVPEMIPVEGSSVSPDGKLPASSAQV
jgi:hypothetical protein